MTVAAPAPPDAACDAASFADRRAAVAQRIRERRLRRLPSSGELLTTAEIISATGDELIAAFEPLARSAASRWGDGTEDDLADARVGLVKAVKSYDSDRGAFVHWARLYMRQEIRRSRHRQRSHIAIPAGERQKLANLYAASERTGSPATGRTDLAARTGMQCDEIAALLAQPKATVVADLDSPHRGPQPQGAAPTSSALAADDVIAEIEAAVGGELPDDLTDRIRWWLRHDGSDTALRQITAAVQQLRPAA